MQVIDGLNAAELPFQESVVAIGAFDGIHIGHRAIIQTAVTLASKRGCPAVVFTFDRHPAELLRPEAAPAYISTPQQRISLVQELNADYLVVAHFDEALSQLSPEQFVHHILIDRLGAQQVVVGHDFRFGRGRAGDAAGLKLLGQQNGFDVLALEPVMVGDLPASSTRIREYILAGNVPAAEEILGHLFVLTGTVVQGKQVGRTLGFPTANLACSYRQVVPANGIYAVQVELPELGLQLSGACSIGVRPTVEDGRTERTVETFLFDFDADIYGQALNLRFVEYLRPELKFSNLDALVTQMQSDCERAKDILSQFSAATRS